MNELLSALKNSFENEADELNAIPMASYMKNQFEYFGIKSPKRKKIVSSCFSKHKITSEEELYRFVDHAWSLKEREWQYAAMDIMWKCKKLFSEDTIPFTEKLIARKSWWDTVDWLSGNVIGHCLLIYFHQREPYINKWMKSGNMWLKRTCLIFQLKYKEKTDFELMKALILSLKDSEEFFIRKAAGWALRQYSKFRPDLVKNFIDSNPGLSPLTRREGLKYC